MKALRHTQPPNQWETGILSPRVKRPGREADYSLPFTAEVKNAWSYMSTLPIRLRCVVTDREDNFTSYFTNKEANTLLRRDRNVCKSKLATAFLHGECHQHQEAKMH
jgi:hypothetical protein